tara:strand:+ start:1276 stop:1422 length:147 start_codon:yes stop_codon:yes gene_type:complete
MKTVILKEKRNLKEKIDIYKRPINTMIPSFYYKNKKGEIIVPKTSIYL